MKLETKSLNNAEAQFSSEITATTAMSVAEHNGEFVPKYLEHTIIFKRTAVPQSNDRRIYQNLRSWKWNCVKNGALLIAIGPRGMTPQVEYM